MSELFFEIGCEEIPSSYIAPAADALAERVRLGLADLGVASEPNDYKTFATPRRIAISVTGLVATRLVQKVTHYGPPKKAAYRDGEPTKAAIGFARSKGVDLSALTIGTTDKGEYLCVEVEEGGENVADLLATLLPDLVAKLPFPKSMTWGDGTYSFTRPVHWVVALFDGVVIPLTIAGVSSGNETRGHRFMAPDFFAITGADDYEEKLQEAFVIADPDKRKKEILEGAEIAAKKVADGAYLNEDDELAEMTAYLTEWPVPLHGTFEEEFLTLPDELLIASMKDHQKMFAVRSADGKLTNGFVGVSNMPAADNAAVVVAGYRRVLRARLSDAMFFYEEDKKKPLADFAKKLDGVVYQKKLGTVAEKVLRIAKLSRCIAQQVEPDNAALAKHAALVAKLCKTDLETLMVYEFPELQGIAGREYARAAGEPEEICNAIEQHYWPHSSGDDRTPDTLGAIVSVADRIDTICGIFGIGQKPSGTKDPFALRRHTLAIVTILQNMGWDIPLLSLIDVALDDVKEKIDLVDGVAGEIENYFAVRLKGYLVDNGGRPDVAESVIEIGIGTIPDLLHRSRAMNKLTKNPAVFEPLAVAFKRVANITKEHELGEIDTSLFEADIEQRLYDETMAVMKMVGKSMSNKDYFAALEKIATLRPTVDKFFDDVLVMADNERVKNNRLNLLAQISALLAHIADFSKIVTKG